MEQSNDSRVNELRLILMVPSGMKFVPNVPMTLAAASSDTDIVTIGASESDNPERPVIFPITADSGHANIYLYYKVLTRTTGAERTYITREGKLKIPVIAGDFDDSSPEIIYEIEH